MLSKLSLLRVLAKIAAHTRPHPMLYAVYVFSRRRISGIISIRQERRSRFIACAPLYADDAVVTLVDRSNTPSSPCTLRGRHEIRRWIEDTCDRDMPPAEH